MFDVARLNLAGQWHTPSLGELAELLVFYDQVDIRTPVGRLGELLPNEIADLQFFRELVKQQKISICIDQTPLGEVVWEMGLLGDLLSDKADPAATRQRLRDAYFENCPPPLNRLVARDASYTRAWSSEWECVLSMAINPMQRDEAYVDQLIANAEIKLPLITEPDFLTTALDAYATDASPKTRRLLRQLTTRKAEFEGRDVVAFNTEWLRTTAELLEFLSQADVLLDSLDGREGVDNYTFPAFDKWTNRLIAGSLSRVGVREELSAFQTSVLGASTIASAIDSQARPFREIESLLVAREPLAKAVRGRPPDTSLTQAYFQEIQKVSRLTQGPGKIVRFSLFAGAGIMTGALLTPVAGAAIGIGLNAIDSFVIDKLIMGNACRSFVDEGLRPFVTNHSPSDGTSRP